MIANVVRVATIIQQTSCSLMFDDSHAEQYESCASCETVARVTKELRKRCKSCVSVVLLPLCMAGDLARVCVGEAMITSNERQCMKFGRFERALRGRSSRKSANGSAQSAGLKKCKHAQRERPSERLSHCRYFRHDNRRAWITREWRGFDRVARY